MSDITTLRAEIRKLALHLQESAHRHGEVDEENHGTPIDLSFAPDRAWIEGYVARQPLPPLDAARKRHRCDWCWQAVEIGRPYRRYRVFAQGEASTMREHPECYEAMCEAAEEEGGWIEWTPGQERPQEMSR